jgi:hypothetical protein
MHTSTSLFVPGTSASELFAHVAVLDRYPPWMRLIHRVEAIEPDQGRPAWRVELRARVGPFARSKSLRMVRTVFEPDRTARFERIQDDDRDHAEWILLSTVEDVEGGALLVMDLTYTGKLWGSGILQRILDEEIRRGKDELRRLVSVEPTR